MIDQKSVIIGFIVSIVLTLTLGYLISSWPIHCSPCWCHSGSILSYQENPIESS